MQSFDRLLMLLRQIDHLTSKIYVPGQCSQVFKDKSSSMMLGKCT
jgi:hypothetical protein